MRLRTQFLISLIVFALIIAVIVASVFVTDIRLAELHNQRDVASDVEGQISTLGYISINYFLYQQNASVWQSTVANIYTQLASLNSTDPQQQELVNAIQTDLESVNDTFGTAISALNGTQLNQSIGGLTMFETLWEIILSQIQHLSLDAEQLSRWIDRASNDINQANLTLVVVLIGLFTTYFFLMYSLVFKRTLKSISNLRRKTKQISQGDLNYLKDTQQNDEIGELSADVDSMVSNLKRTTATKDELEKEINERKKAETALIEAQTKLKNYTTNLENLVQERTKKILESEQSYRDLYESFGEAFIDTDWELNVIHWNNAAERVTRIKATDAIGRKVYEVLPEFMSVDVTPYYEALRNNQPARFMMNVTSRETGKEATFEISTYPSAHGIIIIVEDKTEEEQTKRLLAIGQTAGMVGHDIRNPLQAITSDLYLINEELRTVPECAEREGIQESLRTIDENITYINKIVSDLQDYTRVLAPQHNRVDVNGVLRSVISAAQIPQGIQTKMETEKGLYLNTDVAYLKRILSNLIINAVQAMPEGGELTLKAHIKDGHIAIGVRDTGVGIPKEAQEKIFTPLFTTKAKGQGLGLAVVKRLVEGLKGTIAYNSVEGVGTEFIVELPLEAK